MSKTPGLPKQKAKTVLAIRVKCAEREGSDFTASTSRSAGCFIVSQTVQQKDFERDHGATDERRKPRQKDQTIL
jgi:hypothetical protein